MLWHVPQPSRRLCWKTVYHWHCRNVLAVYSVKILRLILWYCNLTSDPLSYILSLGISSSLRIWVFLDATLCRWVMKMKALHFFAESGATDPWHSITSHKTWILSPHCCENVEFCNRFLLLKLWFPFSVGIWIFFSVQDTTWRKKAPKTASLSLLWRVTEWRHGLWRLKPTYQRTL